MKKLVLVLKFLLQLGPLPLLLYATYRLGIRTGHFRRLDAAMHSDAARTGPYRAVLPLPDADALARCMSSSARAQVRRESDAVASGHCRIFGDRLVPLKLTAIRPLRHWTEYERHPELLQDFDLPHGDVKFLWEPARFGWAYALGRMYHLTRRESYARAFWKYFEAFDKGNPAYVGPHWINGQEVAIRLIALLWARQVLATARESTGGRLARLEKSIALHAARIPPTLMYARSQDNNHLVTESAALYLAGAAFGHAEWRQLGWTWLNRALVRQIGPYGEYIQHSTNYHRLMLQTALVVDAARRTEGSLWPTRTQVALSRAGHWLFSLLDPVSGRVPNLGANDGSHILPLSSCPHDDFRPTVQAAARAFLHTALRSGDWDETALWLGLPQLEHTAESVAYAAEHLRSPKAWAYLRASSHKTRLCHMDQLHVDLWWQGVNIACDAGTYLYSGRSPWDNPLVSSLVHNVVTVDAREQMLRGGKFLVLDWFPAWSEPVLSAQAPIVAQMRASHNGFAMLGLRYKRTLSVLESGRWRVNDDLVFSGAARRAVRLHWLLMDGKHHLRMHDSGLELRVRSHAGGYDVNITWKGGLASHPGATLVRAGKLLSGTGTVHPYDGWVSPTYGRIRPALSLSIEVEASAACFFTTEFRLPA